MVSTENMGAGFLYARQLEILFLRCEDEFRQDQAEDAVFTDSSSDGM